MADWHKTSFGVADVTQVGVSDVHVTYGYCGAHLVSETIGSAWQVLLDSGEASVDVMGSMLNSASLAIIEAGTEIVDAAGTALTASTDLFLSHVQAAGQYIGEPIVQIPDTFGQYIKAVLKYSPLNALAPYLPLYFSRAWPPDDGAIYLGDGGLSGGGGASGSWGWPLRLPQFLVPGDDEPLRFQNIYWDDEDTSLRTFHVRADFGWLLQANPGHEAVMEHDIHQCFVLQDGWFHSKGINNSYAQTHAVLYSLVPSAGIAQRARLNLSRFGIPYQMPDWDEDPVIDVNEPFVYIATSGNIIGGIRHRITCLGKDIGGDARPRPPGRKRRLKPVGIIPVVMVMLLLCGGGLGVGNQAGLADRRRTV